MNKAKNFEEIMSSEFSEFSEESDSQEEQYEHSDSPESEDIEKLSKNVARDFWLKKDTTSTSKKGREKDAPKKHIEGGLLRKDDNFRPSGGEEAIPAPPSSQPRKLFGPKAVINQLSRLLSSRGRQRAAVEEETNALMEIERGAASDVSKALLFCYLSDMLTEGFAVVKTDQQWDRHWNTCREAIERMLDLIGEDGNAFLDDYEALKDLFGEKAEEREEDVDLSSKKLIFIKERLTKNILNNSISSFVFALNEEWANYSKKDQTLLRIEKSEACKRELMAVLVRAKTLFRSTASKENLMLVTSLLLGLTFQCYSEKADRMGEDRRSDEEGDMSSYLAGNEEILNVNFDQKLFDDSDIEAMAIFVVLHSELYSEKIKALLQLATFWAIHNDGERARQLMSLVATKMDPEEKDETLKVLFNRTWAQISLSHFRSGNFDAASEILDCLWKNRKAKLGQVAKNIETFVSPPMHISMEAISAAYMLSSIFREAVCIKLRENGLEAPSIAPHFAEKFRRYQQNFMEITFRRDYIKALAFGSLAKLLQCDRTQCVEELGRADSLEACEQARLIGPSLARAARETAFKIFAINILRGSAGKKVGVAMLARLHSLEEARALDILRELIAVGELEESELEQDDDASWCVSSFARKPSSFESELNQLVDRVRRVYCGRRECP